MRRAAVVKALACEVVTLKKQGRSSTPEGRQAWRQLANFVYRARLTPAQNDAVVNRILKRAQNG